MTKQTILQHFESVRRRSVAFCEPLIVEDYGLQADVFASPPKWHLAHTTWFFETFLLKPFAKSYQSPSDHYQLLFNSYYNGIGDQFSRAQRGLLSRPSVDEVMAYRNHVNKAMTDLLLDTGHEDRQTIVSRCRLGIEHEQQHQELFLHRPKILIVRKPHFSQLF